MYSRLLSLPVNSSLFLFGPRGTGKSTLVKESFSKETTLWFDLLLPSVEDRLMRFPESLVAEIEAAKTKTHIVIDEVQKLPRLLDVVHSQIESTTKHFILTASSARKLRRGGANLLAGRALVFNLGPFSSLELSDRPQIPEILAYGTLPKVINSPDLTLKRRFLNSYALTYLKEEIQAEQVVRNLAPFRRFLEVAAQNSGKIINHAAIARDVGADEKTVKSYYGVLEDTLLGKTLEPFHTSFRKRLSQKPKFFLFDTGVQRALSRQVTLPLQPGTSVFGELFEAFIINECIRLSSYAEKDFAFSYLMTRDGVEIDLVVERPGQPLLLVEIKSATLITAEHLSSLRTLGQEFKGAELICISQSAQAEQYGDILVLPWKVALQTYFSA